MHLKVNNSEDNFCILKNGPLITNVFIASNHSTKCQCCTIKSNEVFAFVVEKTRNWEIDYSRWPLKNLRSNLHVFIIRVS